MTQTQTQHSPPLHPLLLDLTDRLVVVVGGGPVSARRAGTFHAAGARLRVIAPQLCEDLMDLLSANPDRIEWLARAYLHGDLDDAWLAHTATGDAEADAAITAAAAAARVWCIDATAAERGTARSAAVATGPDGIVVAVNGGGDPGRAQAIRDAVQVQLDTAALPLRSSASRRRPTRSGTSGEISLGSVALVGGGPGEVGLLTLRGRQLLAQADVVVHDRLGATAVLAELDPSVDLINVGKTPGHHPVPQSEINQILIDQARLGRRVVRLKGGDPFVFGRGSEELLACREAGIAVEVVPGITSAFSVPAAAGIPVTHRGLSRSVTVATGHDGLDDDTCASSDTLVFLMGVSRLGDTATSLITRGRSPQTPVAIIERGWTPQQRTTTATLATIAQVAAARDVRSPAVIVVGEVAAFASSDPAPTPQ